MARQLRISSFGVSAPPRRMAVGPHAGQTVGLPEPTIVARIISDDLKSNPVHEVELTEDKALELIAQLAEAVTDRRKLIAQRARQWERS